MKEFLFGMFVVLFSTKSIVFAIIRNQKWPLLQDIDKHRTLASLGENLIESMKVI